MWDSNLREEYKRRIEASDTVNIFDRAHALISSENVTVADIDTCLRLIVNGIENCTLPKNYVMGTRNNHLNVTVLLSTLNVHSSC